MADTKGLVKQIFVYEDGSETVVNFKPLEGEIAEGMAHAAAVAAAREESPAEAAPSEAPAEEAAPVEAPVEEAPAGESSEVSSDAPASE